MKTIFTALLFVSLITNANAQTVYKTPTGKKYHVKGHYESGIPISLSEAKGLSLGPCAVCKPIVSADSNTQSEAANPVLTQSKPNTNTSQSRQCRGTTKAGQQCKRMTTDSAGYCYQHK